MYKYIKNHLMYCRYAKCKNLSGIPDNICKQCLCIYKGIFLLVGKFPKPLKITALQWLHILRMLKKALFESTQTMLFYQFLIIFKLSSNTFFKLFKAILLVIFVSFSSSIFEIRISKLSISALKKSLKLEKS